MNEEKRRAELKSRYPDDCVVLPSGQAFYAHRGVVGIDANGEISEGWDGGIGASLTPTEEIELADLMIARWTEFKRKAEEQRDRPADHN